MRKNWPVSQKITISYWREAEKQWQKVVFFNGFLPLLPQSLPPSWGEVRSSSSLSSRCMPADSTKAARRQAWAWTPLTRPPGGHPINHARNLPPLRSPFMAFGQWRPRRDAVSKEKRFNLELFGFNVDKNGQPQLHPLAAYFGWKKEEPGIVNIILMWNFKCIYPVGRWN